MDTPDLQCTTPVLSPPTGQRLLFVRGLGFVQVRQPTIWCAIGPAIRTYSSSVGSNKLFRFGSRRHRGRPARPSRPSPGGPMLCPAET